jgi:glycosyltransferase involved in cell wall biosynthesis
VSPPTISIVTPSFNHGGFIDTAIRSMVSQDYPNLDYVVMDGGSADDSVETIRSYAEQLSHWESGPDAGMYDALNRGFERSTGEIMGWLNCDDAFFPWTLSVVGQIFESFPEIEWLTSLSFIKLDLTGRVVDARSVRGFSRSGFKRGEHFPIGKGWFATNSVPTESTFWRRSLWERAGAYIDASFECSGDWELFARFAEHADLYGVRVPLAGQRQYEDQKSVVLEPDCIAEAERIVAERGIKPRGPFVSRWLSRFARYLPPEIARVTGAIHESKNVIFRDGSWRIESGYTGLVRS